MENSSPKNEAEKEPVQQVQEENQAKTTEESNEQQPVNEESTNQQESPKEESSKETTEAKVEEKEVAQPKVEEEPKSKVEEAPKQEVQEEQKSEAQEVSKQTKTEESENGNEGKQKKTLADAARQVMKELDQNSFSNAYAGAILDRKKESFLNFQNRDQQRKNTAETNKAIVSSLVSVIDARVAWIGSAVDKTVKFFKDRASQEEEYMKIMTSTLPKLGTFFKDPAKPDFFTNLSAALDGCDEFHIRQSKNSEIMAKFLRKELLEKMILASEKDFKKHYDAIRSPLDEVKKKLGSLVQDRAKKQRAYIFAYNEAQRGGKITKERDMCYKEIENTIVGYEESKLAKAYATQALLLLNETVKLLIKRMTEIQKALTLYFQKYIDLYGYKASNPEEVMQLLQKFNGLEEIQQIFAVKNMLSPEELKYFQDNTGKTEIGYQEVFDVFVKLPPVPQFEKGPLILKGWKASKEGGLLKGSKPCDVAVTIDSHILILEKSSDGEGVDNVTILSLKNSKIVAKEDRKDHSFVDLVETSPGVLMDSKTKVSLKFGNEDNAEEFRHYVYNFFNSVAL